VKVQEDLAVGRAAEECRRTLEGHGAVGGGDHREDDPRTITHPSTVTGVIGLGDRDLADFREQHLHGSFLPARVDRQ